MSEKDPRFSRLEVYDDDESKTHREFRVGAPLSAEEREQIRDYLAALDDYERAEAATHPPPPVAWERIRELVVAHPREVERRSGDSIVYRTVEANHGLGAVGAGMIVCRQHLVELAPFRFHRGERLRVRALGIKEREWEVFVRPEGEPLCRLCQTTVAHGNVCYNDRCRTPLHPQWPAVYCSNECALEDR